MDAIKVLSQRQLEKVLEDGEVHSVVSIALTIGKAGPFTLDVPIDEYHEENVVALARDLESRQGHIRFALENMHDPNPPPRPPRTPAPPPPGTRDATAAR